MLSGKPSAFLSKKEVHGGLVHIMPFIGALINDQAFTLMSLGSWEGCAIVFVIVSHTSFSCYEPHSHSSAGCGIGVLLWSGSLDEESNYTAMIFEQDT